ncbi:Acetoacetate metabolism regulatory protein AtoC [Chlamydiales bacterium STE3]|nr:Acetoacetate metabolism regulatory protein AtoC [Chlamydiales bacterium STE3]
MPIEKILIVDDEKLVRDFLAETLRRKHFDVTLAENGQRAMLALKDTTFDLVITDMKMPDHTGIDILKRVKEISPGTIVVIITAYGSVENAVEAMRLGAFNYLIKPFSPDTIEAVIDKAKEHLALLEENSCLKQQLQTTDGNAHSGIVVASPAMKKIFNEVAQIAKSNANVLITGESGTGKEVIAHAIHYQSSRANRPFIKVNCAAIPETLIESEFFGHEKGAFTGASAMHRGRFELANGGTLLLDEITEVPLGLQAKLLRAIQEQEFERVGGIKPVKVDVRIISTSNRNMNEAIVQKKIREDLFYRLNVMPIHLPPLRERKEDLLPLSEFFIEKLCLENHKEKKHLSEEARKKILNYDWPGNVRELANILERAVVLSSADGIAAEDIYLTHLSSLNVAKGTLPFGITLQELEKRLIIETMHKLNNNRTKTAEMLGISVRTLRNKLQEYDLSAQNSPPQNG